MASAKLPTSREIYDRIRWDARFTRSDFVIGYDHHGAEPKEIAFEAFSPGEIPWHRVLYFKQRSFVVWDRRTKLDLLSSVAGGGRAEADSTFEPRPAYRWDGALWIEGALASEARPRTLRILTWNVLFDTFDAEKLDTEARIPKILERLEHADADVIALEEVTPRFLEKLLQRPWVRSRYALSEGELARTVDPSGQLLLSRFPLTNVAEHRFSRAKHVLTGDVAGITFAVVHLTSDYEPNAEATRARQLDLLLDHVANAKGPVVVLGDFNAGDEVSLPLRDLIDVWPALHPDDPGVTFDPKANRLAAMTTRRDLARRLDRILVRGIAPQRIELFANDDACPSDHYGVLSEIAVASAHDLAPVHETAVVVVPPESAWGPIQALRSVHDRHYARWMPHITLLYGFVPESSFEEALPLVVEAAQSIEPFHVSLRELDSFPHARSSTIWAEPATAPPRALHELEVALERAFPKCNEQSRKSDAGFTPHLSLGSVAKDAPRAIAEWQAMLPPLSWAVHDVALVARRGNGPMEIVRRVPLGRAVEDACARISGGRVFTFGAHALGIETETSDRDLVCVARRGAITRERFFAELAASLPNVRIANDAFVPVARIEHDGWRTEIAFAELPEGAPLDLPSAGAIHAMDLVSQRSIGGVLDARALLAVVSRVNAVDRFRRIARRVRAWARARQIDQANVGFPARFTWTLLAAKAAMEDGDVFELFASWDWAKPVALTEDATAYRPHDRDRMIVPSLVAPVRNSARAITRSTHRIVVDELRRARDIVRGGGSEAELMCGVTPMGHDAWVMFRSDDATLLRTYLARHFIELLLRLEEDTALVLRPYGPAPHEHVLAVDGIDPATLRDRLATEASEGVTVEVCAPA